ARAAGRVDDDYAHRSGRKGLRRPWQGEQRSQKENGDAHQRARKPESTGNVTPVMQRAASLHRNKIAAAMSSVSGSRPSGVCPITVFSSSGLEKIGVVRSVRT